MVGQVAGLVSLLLALVLGTLIGTSFAFFGGQKTALEGLSAQILEFDQALAQYGPETKPARDKLKEATQKAYDAFWGGGEADPALLSVASPMAALPGDEGLSRDAHADDRGAEAGARLGERAGGPDRT